MASFGVGVVVLSFLLLLTWLGTVSQVDTSLYDVQKKYFDSWIFFEDVGSLKIPLPGAFLLNATWGRIGTAGTTQKVCVSMRLRGCGVRS